MTAAAAHVGATTHAPLPPPQLTFTYAPADIQGLAEPRNGGGGIQVGAQQPHHHGHQTHLVQAPPRQPLPQPHPQQVQQPGGPQRMHIGNTSGLSMSAGARTSKKKI